MNKIVVAIDGFSSCGKSSMAKDLARKVGYKYIDSGAMYRAITLYCLENNIIKGDFIDENSLKELLPSIKIDFKKNILTGTIDTYLNGEDVEKKIRTMTVSNMVSRISAIPFVRHLLVSLQQDMGKEKGIIMDGRDIGTTVFPNAELKIFLTASPEVRAQRRVNELISKGDNVSFEEVLENVKSRDEIDQNRKESPLRMADDAVLLDNSDLTIAQQDEWLMNKFNEAVEKANK